MHRLTAFYATNELVVAAVTNGDADGTDVGLTTEVCRFRPPSNCYAVKTQLTEDFIGCTQVIVERLLPMILEAAKQDPVCARCVREMPLCLWNHNK